MKLIPKDAIVQISLEHLSALIQVAEKSEQYERWYHEEKLMTNKVLLFEKALEKAALTILNYQTYIDTHENDIPTEGKGRDDYLRQARMYEENFKELIKEIKTKEAI